MNAWRLPSSQYASSKPTEIKFYLTVRVVYELPRPTRSLRPTVEVGGLNASIQLKVVMDTVSKRELHFHY